MVEARFDEVFGSCSDMFESSFKPLKRCRLDFEVSEAIAYGQLGGSSSSGAPQPGVQTQAVRVHGAVASRIWKGLKGGHGPKAPVENVLLRYFLSSRMHLTSASSMSVAIDASRVGKREILAGVVVARSGISGDPVAACMPPQAPGIISN